MRGDGKVSLEKRDTLDDCDPIGRVEVKVYGFRTKKKGVFLRLWSQRIYNNSINAMHPVKLQYDQ